MARQAEGGPADILWADQLCWCKLICCALHVAPSHIHPTLIPLPAFGGAAASLSLPSFFHICNAADLAALLCGCALCTRPTMRVLEVLLIIIPFANF